MENQMEEQMENQMETAAISGLYLSLKVILAQGRHSVDLVPAGGLVLCSRNIA